MEYVYRDDAFARTLPSAPFADPGVHAADVHPFQAWTESLYINGAVRSPERLSDVLNRREPVRLLGGSVVPLCAPRAAAHTDHQIVLDPFDFDFVLGGKLKPDNRAANAAKRIHKVAYPVLVAGSNFEVRGTMHVFAGNSVEYAAQHTGQLFFPITNPIVRREGRVVSDPATDVCLVNRYTIRRIVQLDTLN